MKHIENDIYIANIESDTEKYFDFTTSKYCKINKYTIGVNAGYMKIEIGENDYWLPYVHGVDIK